MIFNNITVLFINFIVVVIFTVLSKHIKKTYLLSLIYAIILAVVALTQPFLISVLLISFIGNFVISYIFFKILKYSEGSFLYLLIAVVGCLVLWYIAYLPIGYSVFEVYEGLRIIGE